MMDYDVYKKFQPPVQNVARRRRPARITGSLAQKKFLMRAQNVLDMPLATVYSIPRSTHARGKYDEQDRIISRHH